VRVELRVEAEEDLARIYEFNMGRSARWADQVEQRLLERAGALTTAPRAGRAMSKAGIRRLSVPDIHYVIDYRLTDTLIEILRFQHSREIR
jgi:plasmid stabilization system protein ParE